VVKIRKPRADLERQLETYRRELAEAREHLAEALEQQCHQQFGAGWNPFSRQCSRMLLGFARPSSESCGWPRVTDFGRSRCTPRLLHSSKHGSASRFVWVRNRVAKTKQVVHIPDLTAEQTYAQRS
jgi:hypothetical protein